MRAVGSNVAAVGRSFRRATIGLDHASLAAAALPISIVLGSWGAACSSEPGGRDASLAIDAAVQDDGSLDGGNDAPLPIEPEPPIPPLDVAEPASASLTPCPDGWIERRDERDAAASCAPWDEAPRPACGPGFARFLGENACVPVGRACPTTAFGDVPTMGATRFVLAGAAPDDADGSRERPFATIGAALEGVSAETTIVVGRGHYDEALVVPSGVTLAGACAAETAITSSIASSVDPVVRVAGEGVVLRDLRIASSPRPGIALSGDAFSVELRGVAVEGVEGEGIIVVRGRIVVDGLCVRDTVPRAGDSATGRAMRISVGATAQIRRAIVERNRFVAISAFDPGTTLVLEDSAVLDTDRTDAGRGVGLQISTGATATIARSIFERNRGHGVLVACNEPGCGAMASFEDIVVRDTAGDDGETRGRALGVQDATVVVRRALLERFHAAGLYGFGQTLIDAEDLVLRDGLSRTPTETPGAGAIIARTGARVHVRRAIVERGGDLGVHAGDEATLLAIDDLVVSATGDPPIEAEYGGGAALATDGARLELSRARLEGSQGYGVVVGYAGTSARLVDLQIDDTLPYSESAVGGNALSVEHGATVEIERARLERNRDVAMFVLGEASLLRATDVVVSDTAPETFGVNGVGLNVRDGRAELRRCVVERNFAAGIAASCSRDTAAACAALVELEDVLVRDTRGEQARGIYGRGLALHVGASARATRTTIEDSREFAVSVGEGGSLEAIDFVVRRTHQAACAETTCPDAPGGSALAVVGGSSANVSRFHIEESALCGAMLADRSEIDLADGELAANAIAICVQVDGYDVDRLLAGVSFRDNDRNLQSTSLPVPSPAVP